MTAMTTPSALLETVLNDMENLPDQLQDLFLMLSEKDRHYESSRRTVKRKCLAIKNVLDSGNNSNSGNASSGKKDSSGNDAGDGWRGC